jgi:methionyl-tRNA formyltransferase
MDLSTLRIIFMGTPDFAVPALRKLVEGVARTNWQVIAAVTQPDRPAGRGKRLVASPVKEYAQAQGLPVLQPQSLRKDPGAVEALRQLAPDLIVVAAYGLILPKPVLEIPRFGCLNIHASLLPAYRGASPITAALLDGLSMTGVSIMVMDEGMDTGPVLTQAHHAIDPVDTTASLSGRLAELGATFLITTLPHWVSGELKPIAQERLPGVISYCRLIKKEDGRIDWSQPAVQIERMTRAYTPWPSAYTSWRGEPFKILQAAVAAGSAEPGQVVVTSDGPAVGTGEGLLLLRTVQPAGKRALDMGSFLNGAPDFIGQRLPN